MKKALKIIGILLGAFLAFALILVLTLPLWIGCVVTTAANSTVPQLTRTEFNLDGFSFNWYNGRLEISGVKLSNPKEFDQKMAFTLGKVFVDIDMSTLFSDPMVIEKIEVKDVFVSYLDGSHGTNNFDVITANVKDSLGIEPEPEDVAEKPETEAPETAAEEEEKSGSERKFIIDDLLIDSVVVQYGAVTLPLKMPIHLTGIGRDLGGLNAENAWKEIFSQFWRSLTNIGSSILNLGSMTLDKASELVDGLKVKEGAGAAAKAASDATGAAAKAASDATGAAAKAVSGAADTTIKATGDAVDKAAGALKGLFK